MSLDKELAEYTAKTSRSRALHEEAVGVMPGGNSRTTTFFDPYPFYFQRGQGAHIWDADGTERIDFNNNYTSLVIGHAHPDVIKAVQAVAESGLSFPGPTEHEVRLAEMLTRRIPSLESVRFTNSGTEATMNAVRLARAFTGRPKLAKFEGAFHGTHDWVMVSVTPDPKTAGNRKRPKPVAWSSGIPPAVLKHTVVLPWNDQEACAEILAREGEQIAGLIVDPLLCNAGLVPQAEGFLQFLRAILNRLLSPSEIARAPSLIRPIAHNLVADSALHLADIIYLVKQLEGISTGAVEFRAVPGTPVMEGSLSVVSMDPVAEQIFARIRQGKPLGALGKELVATPTSEANIAVPVVDHDSGGTALEVEQVLTDAGFDITPGVVDDAAYGAPIKGSAIVYKPGHLTEAEVVQKYFSNLPMVEAPAGALRGSPVAILVTGTFQLQAVGSGGVDTSTCVTPSA